ncbi:hypothetical protein D3C85_1912360 [compost metagenome]
MLNSKLVSNHCNELGVRRFGLADVDGIAEQVTDAVNVTACPGYFNRMANGSFYP